MFPIASLGEGQTECVVFKLHESSPITIPSSIEGVKVIYKNQSCQWPGSSVNQPGEYKLTGRTTCTTISEPAETEVSLAGASILIFCPKHVVVKAASNAATVGFMVVLPVVIGESLELDGLTGT